MPMAAGSSSLVQPVVGGMSTHLTLDLGVTQWIDKSYRIDLQLTYHRWKG